LRYGDQNSKYFHACASQKNRIKYIEKIKDVGGRLCQSKEDIEKAFIQYYDDLFTAGNEIDLEPCLNAMDCKVSPEMNSKLMAEPTVEEIHTALHQMAPMKAPGPDGYSVCFYQHNWKLFILRYAWLFSISFVLGSWIVI
jgi:hypothetical protein